MFERFGQGFQLLFQAFQVFTTGKAPTGQQILAQGLDLNTMIKGKNGGAEKKA